MARMRQSTATTRLVPRVKVWLETDGDYVFGWGLCEILIAVRDTGSMKLAAAQLGKSYRHVWGRIKAAEEELGASLVAARVGGAVDQRSDLTELASRLIDDFSAFRARVQAVASAEFSGRFAELHRLARRKPTP